MEIISIPTDLRSLSHELRIPLTGILGMAEILNAESLTPVQREYLNDIRQAGDHLLEVVNLLLKESKKINPNKG